MTRNKNVRSSDPTGALWARFRFSVVGALLSAPRARGELVEALRALAAKTWTHPITGREVRFARGTMERWYYRARREQEDPVSVLRRRPRKDRGRVSLPTALATRLTEQHARHPHWSYQLHYDNLAAQVKADPSLGPLKSYCTVRRYMQAQGLLRKRRERPKASPGERLAAQRREEREIRSYEAEYAGSLWHLDFHHGSLQVLTSSGQWRKPIVLGVLDDYSRLCCHLQWYLSETTEDLVHGFSQAIQKRGLPRALLTDNGSAMLAEEFTEGLLRLGILHQTTLPFSAYQNGKQEVFWSQLEGRLMEMLTGHPQLTLDFLNEVTQAWVEVAYHQTVHRETGKTPVERFAQGNDVLRSSPTSSALRAAFRVEVKRRQRQSDGTLSLAGVRFEVPSRFRHFHELWVRYARWDLGHVDLVDPQTGIVLAAIYPLDRTANADSRRAAFAPDGGNSAVVKEPPRGYELPPLLKQILAEFSATGRPPAYLPQPPETSSEDANRQHPEKDQEQNP
jgi:transposase InsO family protein